MHIVVTGAAGFIGSNLIPSLLKLGHQVTGLDNFDPFYSRLLKEHNLKSFNKDPCFTFFEADICDESVLRKTFQKAGIDCIIHLAAMAGVRPSLEDPAAYYNVNVNGTLNMLELARRTGVKRFILASSSSVYGNNPDVPWKTNVVTSPISPYASSKVAAESLCNVYAHLYRFPVIALRFFTVYGPGQRPDLAIHKFFKLITEGKAVPFFGDGSTARDYTYIDDIVNGILGALRSSAGKGEFKLYNLGNSTAISLNQLVEKIGATIGRVPQLDKLPKQEGDVERTCADISESTLDLAYKPSTSFETGLKSFYQWFLLANEKKIL